MITIDPSDSRALAALEGLFTREGRGEEAIEVREKRALVLDDEAQRREPLLQAAATWEEKVEDPTRAALVYERVRAGEPANLIASDRLDAIYTQRDVSLPLPSVQLLPPPRLVPWSVAGSDPTQLPVTPMRATTSPPR